MEQQQQQSKSKKPAATRFKQQQLKAWQPILTPKPVIATFFILGVVFLALGIPLLIASNQVVESSVRYDNKCDINSDCTVILKVEEKMEKPVYFYYRLENYYQNHRRYVKSRNDNQLRGEKVTSYSSLEDCDPVKSQGDSRNPDNFFLPCGLIAKSLFNDTFTLRNTFSEPVPMRKEGIAWRSDVKDKFNNPPADTRGIRVIANFEDEDFIVWMRTAGLPNFKKLYRIIDVDLEPGNYTVNIFNTYPVSEFDGRKYVVLSTTSWIGGKNPFLGIAYIVVGVLCLLLGVGFGIRHYTHPRKLGDTRYLDWSK